MDAVITCKKGETGRCEWNDCTETFIRNNRHHRFCTEHQVENDRRRKRNNYYKKLSAINNTCPSCGKRIQPTSSRCPSCAKGKTLKQDININPQTPDTEKKPTSMDILLVDGIGMADGKAIMKKVTRKLPPFENFRRDTPEKLLKYLEQNPNYDVVSRNEIEQIFSTHPDIIIKKRERQKNEQVKQNYGVTAASV